MRVQQIADVPALHCLLRAGICVRASLPLLMLLVDLNTLARIHRKFPVFYFSYKTSCIVGARQLLSACHPHPSGLSLCLYLRDSTWCC